MTHIPRSRMKERHRRHYDSVLGPSPRPYNYNSKYAEKRYKDLSDWLLFTESSEYWDMRLTQTEAQIERTYAQTAPLPRFQNDFQVDTFISNMNHKLHSSFLDEPEYYEWHVGRNCYLAPHDFRFWTVKQRIAYRDDWFSDFNGLDSEESNQKLDQLTYDQRESMGLLSKKEYLKLKKQRRDLYEILFDPVASGYTVDHKSRNRMTLQKNS